MGLVLFPCMRYIVMVGVEISFRVNDKKLRRRSRFFGCGGASWVVVVCHEEAIDSDLVEVLLFWFTSGIPRVDELV